MKPPETQKETQAEKELRLEIQRLREREKLCETIDQAEKLALLRALQEIRDETHLLGEGISPRDIVQAVKTLKENKREMGTRLEMVYKQLDAAQEDIKKLQDQITGWENKWKCAVEMAAQAEVKHDSLLEEFKQIRKERDEALSLITASLTALPVGYLPAHTPESIPERIGDLCSEIVHLEKENEEISERLQQETEEARKLATHWRNKISSKTKHPLPWENQTTK